VTKDSGKSTRGKDPIAIDAFGVFMLLWTVAKPPTAVVSLQQHALRSTSFQTFLSSIVDGFRHIRSLSASVENAKSMDIPKRRQRRSGE